MKKFSAILLIICLILTLCACGQQNVQTAQAEAAPKTEEKPIVKTASKDKTEQAPTEPAQPQNNPNLATLAGAKLAEEGAKFNLDSFKSNSNYTVTSEGNDNIITPAVSTTCTLPNDNGGASINFKLVGNDSMPYIMKVTCSYEGNKLPGAQKFIILTDKHRFDFSPTVSNNNNTESLSVNLANKESLELLNDIAAKPNNISFSILGSAKTIDGTFTVKDGSKLQNFHDDYISAGGLAQNLIQASTENTCTILEIVAAQNPQTQTVYVDTTNNNANKNGKLYASPSSGMFNNVYNSVNLYSNYGDRIHYEVYSGSYLISSGEINNGECVWITGTNGYRTDVYLKAYVVGNPSNAISCSYTVDCTYYYYSSGNNNNVTIYSNSPYQQYVDIPWNGYDPSAYQYQQYVTDPNDGYDIEADFYNWVTGGYSVNGDKFDDMFSQAMSDPSIVNEFNNLTDEEFFDLLEEGLAAYDIP